MSADFARPADSAPTPGAPTRRGILGVIAASAGALVGVAPGPSVCVARAPAAPPLEAPDPSAVLRALVAESQRLLASEQAALDAIDEADERFFLARPARPASLIATARDVKLFGLSALRPGEPYDRDAVANIKIMIPTAPAPRDDMPPFAKAFLTRATEIVADFEQWQAAEDQADAAAGREIAERELSAVSDALRRLFRRLVKTPAVTVADVMTKIAVVSDYFGDAVARETEDTPDDVLFSATRDLKRLGLLRLLAPPKSADAA